MNRRRFVQAATMAGFGAAAPAIAQSTPSLQWRMTSSFPKSIDAIFGGVQILCRYVAEASDNNFVIRPFAAGELTPGRQALDAVGSGVVECAHTPLFFYAGKDPTLGFGSGLPFGLNARHQQAWWTFAGGAQMVNAALKKFNAYGIPAGRTGAQMGAWFRKEITSLADLKGLKFRVGALGGPILERIGAIPYKLAYADVYAALENGTIDAAEFICPHDDEKLGLVRVAKYNHYPCWWDSGGMMHMVINLDVWTKLPKSYQTIVRQACDAANTWMLANYDALNPPALKRLIAAGAVLKPFPAPVLEACQKAADDYFAEVAAKDATFKKALDSTNAFRKEQMLWWQISEQAYDNLTIGRRDRV